MIQAWNGWNEWKKTRCEMKTVVKRVLIVGSGTIGTQVAALFALRGFDTVMHDVSMERLEHAAGAIARMYNELAAGGHIDAAAAAAGLERLHLAEDLGRAATGVDLVSESVPEDIALKRAVFSQLNEVCDPGTVFTTNTSDLVPSLLADATGRPELFAAFHFHAPLRGGDVLDIMGHPRTSPAVLELLQELAGALGQTPIVLKREHPGYVFNNLLNALTRAALELAVDDVATPETVDMAWKRVMHMPVGPFGILDMVGLDTALRIARLGAEQLQDDGLRRIVDYLAQYVEEGRLGVQSGRGFYEYA